MTERAMVLWRSLASPRSPIFTVPDVPVMKMLSHLRSRWITGGCRECRYSRPRRICRHQLRSIFVDSCRKREMYLHATSTLV